MELSSLFKRSSEAVIGLLPDAPRIALKRSIRNRKEQRRLRDADLTVIAHPKSGGTWLRFQLARLYQQKFGLDESIIPRVERLHDLQPQIPRIHIAGYEYIKHTVARAAPAPELHGKACIFLLRHPIDVVVSLYFHIQKHALHERKLFNDWPLDLSGVSMLEFATQSNWGLMETIGFFNACLKQQAKLDRAHTVRYEDMRQDPSRVLSGIARVAGAEVSEAEAREAAEFTSFKRMREAELSNAFNTNRLHAVDRSDPDSFKVRRAKIFGYRDYFNAEQLLVLEGMLEKHLDHRSGYCKPEVAPATSAIAGQTSLGVS